MTQALTLDHLRYVRNRTYRRRALGRLRRFIAEGRGTVARLEVWHEHDHRCCRREPWPITYRALLLALRDDGESVLRVDLASAPAGSSLTLAGLGDHNGAER